MATKRRRGRGAGGARHEIHILVRFTREQDAAIVRAAEWAGAQHAGFIREAAVTRAREVLAAADAGAPRPPEAEAPAKARKPE